VNVAIAVLAGVGLIGTPLFAYLWWHEREERNIWFEMWHSRSEFITKLLDDRRERSGR
jgi:hypothetical protein